MAYGRDGLCNGILLNEWILIGLFERFFIFNFGPEKWLLIYIW